MIAFPSIAAVAAKAAGMKCPKDPDRWAEEQEAKEFVHFFVFCAVQLGAPMPYPSAHWDNAKLIASLSDEEINSVSFNDLLDRGLAIGNSSTYA